MINPPDSQIAVVAKEKGMYSIDVYAKDTNGNYVTPSSVAWTLTDLSGNIINSRSAVAATPGNPTRITLSGDDLAIVSQANKYEARALLVVTTVSGQVDRLEKYFFVENLISVT